MRDTYNISFTATAFKASVACVLGAIVLFLLSSCSAAAPAHHEAEAGDVHVLPPMYSIVCIIHGDGEYRYLDSTGAEFDAAQDIFADMERVAKDNPLAEVFIFRQLPQSRAAILSRDNGEFSYYRNGRVGAKQAYGRDEAKSRFDPEVALYRRYGVKEQRGMTTLFLYFGRQIPEAGGGGYDASEPSRSFTVNDLASGVKAFAGSSSRFDLLVLSTSFGGSPHTIGALGGCANAIVASPTDIGPAFFDVRLLERVDQNWRDKDVSTFATRFARHVYDCLTRKTNEALRIAVYDAAGTHECIGSVNKKSVSIDQDYRSNR